MEKTWHYCVDGVTAPPIDEPTFVEHCRTGKITDETMVWTTGMEGWQSFAEMNAAAVAVAEAAERRAAKAREEAEAAGQVVRHPCAKCAKEWPEPLMVQPRGRWMCRPCYTRELDEARKKAQHRAERPENHLTNPKFLGALAVVGLLIYFGSTTGYDLVKGYLETPPSQEPEAWIEKPVEEWPQIALAADVQLRGSSQAWRVVNTFLVLDPHNHVLGVGFSRMLGGVAARAGTPPADPPVPAGGVRPGVKVVKAPTPVTVPPPDQMLRWVGTSLAEWRVGAAPAPPAAFTKVHGLPVEYGKSEVLLLDPAQPLAPTASLPGAALRVRTVPVKKDQVVYVVGAPAAQSGAKQSVHPGTLHATFNAQKTLDLAMNAPVDPAAFVGAPVLDEGGHLLGIVNGTLDSPDKNGEINSLSAEGIASFAKALDLRLPALAPPADAPNPGKTDQPPDQPNETRKLLRKMSGIDDVEAASK